MKMTRTSARQVYTQLENTSVTFKITKNDVEYLVLETPTLITILDQYGVWMDSEFQAHAVDKSFNQHIVYWPVKNQSENFEEACEKDFFTIQPKRF
jgi:hypothetical protein